MQQVLKECDALALMTDDKVRRVNNSGSGGDRARRRIRQLGGRGDVAIGVCNVRGSASPENAPTPRPLPSAATGQAIAPVSELVTPALERTGPSCGPATPDGQATVACSNQTLGPLKTQPDVPGVEPPVVPAAVAVAVAPRAAGELPATAMMETARRYPIARRAFTSMPPEAYQCAVTRKSSATLEKLSTDTEDIT